MERLPTVNDVARRSGFSKTTVSRVVNRSGFVSADAREAILEAIDELGYVPSASARGLASRQTGMVGLCLPDDCIRSRSSARPAADADVTIRHDPEPDEFIGWGDVYSSEVMRGAEYAAWEAGLAITVAMSREPDLEARVLNMAGRVDGMVVVGELLPDELLERVAHRVPVVVLAGRETRTHKHDHVTASNAAGMERLVGHLIHDHGLTDLVYVAGRAGARDDDERFQGFCRALEDAGLDVPAEPRLRGDFSRKTARALGTELVRAAADGVPMPAALVCANDETALGLHDVLTASGYRVPGDVVLTGFDGLDAARTSVPPITTVEQPMAELGRLAVEVLTTRMASPRRRPIATTVPVSVLLRGSCGSHERRALVAVDEAVVAPV